MVAVEELDDMEPAFVDIEMDVPCFEVNMLFPLPRENMKNR